ncbi:hypothetical protein FRC03_010464 [Tulasnella sp. 419]|nr:hypothetical protein FRC02_009749 [Tulasnella sp. 418]KAG8967220.1 hypothetical protein FRC03_010464 [Tulasnella sp. 419]
MASRAIQKSFFSSAQFAVVGGSKDESKIGTKLLRWYQAHKQPVTPLHPKEDAIADIKTVRQVSELPFPESTSLSIVTPPKVTLGVLKDAVAAKVPFVWIQPGAEDEAVVEYIKNTEGLSDKVVYGGPCVLVSGEELLEQARL